MTSISTKAKEELHKWNDKSTTKVQNLILKCSLGGEFFDEAPIFNWIFICYTRVEWNLEGLHFVASAFDENF